MICPVPYCLTPDVDRKHVKNHAQDLPLESWPAGQPVVFDTEPHPFTITQIRDLLRKRNLDIKISNDDKCPSCDLRFSYLRQLADHINTTHLNRKHHQQGWSCCGVSFNVPDGVHHYREYHGIVLAPCQLFGIRYVTGAPRFYSRMDPPAVACNWYWVEEKRFEGGVKDEQIAQPRPPKWGRVTLVGRKRFERWRLVE